MNKARVLLLDIETSPNLGYTWGKWETNVIEYKKEWQILSIAYKWLGEKKIHCLSQMYLSEKQLVKEIWSLFDAADVLIGHNGDQFDIKKIKAKFLEYGLKPPSPYKSVDTKKIARSQYAFNSNSLNDLAKTLKIGQKIQTGGFQLWLDCMAGNKAAWLRMIKYNKQDVALLEKIYLKMRAWAPSHPNTNMLAGIKDRPSCPVCAGSHVQARGVQVLRKSRRRRYSCVSCGHWFT